MTEFVERLRLMAQEDREAFVKRFNEATPKEIKSALNARTILGLDPGTTSSAICGYNGHTTTDALLASNEEILAWLKERARLEGSDRPMLVIEKIANMGMAIGQSTLETVYWSGRFAEAYGVDRVDRITRGEIKMYLCGSMRAKDANIRMSLLDKFGGKEKAIGRKSSPGVMYGITSHKIAALAVSVTYHETRIKDIK